MYLPIKKSIFSIIHIGITVLFLNGCVIVYPSTTTTTTTKKTNTTTKTDDVGTNATVTTTTGSFKGKASYFSNSLVGKKTASGEVYDNKKLTAAHKTLPFGTKLEVKNLKNSKTVIVIINDRLPAASTRIIDLSEAAAKALDMIKDGVVDSELRILK